MEIERNFLNEEVILENSRARLTPLKKEDFEKLESIAYHPQIWEKGLTRIATPEGLRKYIDTALDERRSGASYPFLIFDKQAGTAAGSTRFGNISLPNKRMEIGWTWMHPKFQGTGLNKACKLELLKFAFEVLKFNRVELKTDFLNGQSQRAMEKLGAIREGIFRRHCVTWSGRIRDSVYFSYILEDWPATKKAFFSPF